MRALPDGEALFAGVKSRISREARLAFIGAFAAGLVAHLYMLVNKLPNHDDILCLFASNDNTFLGRWFLLVPSEISTRISMPWVNGLLALVWLSLAAVCTVRMLGVRKPAVILLIAAVMATFPTVGYTLCYMFTADAYLFGLLLAAFGAYWTERRPYGFLLGGVCIGLSLGVYQAYVFYAVGLFAIRLLLMLLFDTEASAKALLQKLARFAGALLLGAVVYRVGLSVALALRDTALKSYMGLDGLTALSVSGLISRVPAVYQAYVSFYGGASELLPGRLRAGLFLLINAAAVVLSVAAMARMRGKNRLLRVVLSALILCAMPLLLDGVLLVSTAGMHALMQYPCCLACVLALALYDRAAVVESGSVTRLSQARTLLGYALAASVALSSLLWAADANQAYLALELKFDNMLSLVTRMVDRVEQLPEYVPNETPVWYTGTLSDGNYGAVKNDDYAENDVFARASATDMTGREWNYTFLMNNLYFRAFAENYVGVSFVNPGQRRMDEILSGDAYLAMPYFPAAGSVKCIDGVIIINGGPNPVVSP